MNTIIKNVENEGKRFRTISRSALVAGVSAILSAWCPYDAGAATIAWWRFEDVNAGPGTTLTSQNNAPAVNATVGATGQGLVGLVPNTYITEGSGGPGNANSQSFAHIWAGGQSPVNSTGTSLLNDTFVGNNASWTWEAFINIDSLQYGYGMLFGNGNPTANGIQMDLGADDRSFRFLSGGAAPINTGTLFNFGTWYHIALVATADAGTWDLNFFVNYSSVATASNIALDTLGSDYSIFGALNPAQAFMDEVRISNTALTTSEMLYAVPEPGTAGAACLGLTGLFVLRRFRRA